MPGPLAGIRVIDWTSAVSGPVCTRILADQGADVIKIEPPKGDIARHTSGTGEVTPMFVSTNRGKRSMALDLKTAEAKAALWKLIETADVLVQNMRPGAMERLGFGADDVRKRNPRLVYVSISGVGETGPYVNKRVYDPVIQSLSGIADVQADAETGRPRMVRTIIADKTTAIHAAQAVCAALFARERSGEGQHVRLAMLDTMVSFIWPEAMMQYTVVGKEGGGINPTARPDLIFKTRDGYITVGSVSDSEWRGLCGVLGKAEWIGDPRFATPSQRSLNAAERITLVGEVLAQNDSAYWLPRLDDADVPCAPVLRRSEVFANEQVVNNRIIEEIEQPGLGTVRQARNAARFEATPTSIARPAPRIGEHTVQVLAELGYAKDEIARLAACGAIKVASA